MVNQVIDVQSFDKERKEKDIAKQANKAMEASENVKPVDVKEPEPVSNQPKEFTPEQESIELPKQEEALEIDVEDAEQMTPMNDFTDDDESGMSLMERMYGIKETRLLQADQRMVKEWDDAHRSWLGKTAWNLFSGAAESIVQTSKLPYQLSVMYGTAGAKLDIPLGKTMINWSNDTLNNIDYFLKEINPDADRDSLSYGFGGVFGDIAQGLGVSRAVKAVSKGAATELSKQVASAEKTAGAMRIWHKGKFTPVSEIYAESLKTGVKPNNFVEKFALGFAKEAVDLRNKSTKLMTAIADVPMHFVMSKDVAGMMEYRLGQYRDERGQVDIDKWLDDTTRNFSGVAAYGALAWMTEARFGLGWILKNLKAPSTELTIQALKGVARSDTWLSKMATKHTLSTYIALSTVKEGATEALQEIEQIAAEWAFRLKEKNPEDGTLAYREKNFKEEATRVLVSAVMGGVMGGIASTGHVIMQKRDFVNKVAPVIQEAFPNMSHNDAVKKAKEVFVNYYKDIAPKFAKEEEVKSAFEFNNGVEYQKFVDFIDKAVHLPQWAADPDLRAKNVAAMADHYSSLVYNLCNSLGIPMYDWEKHLTLKQFITNEGAIGVQFLYDGKPLTEYTQPKEVHKEMRETENGKVEEDIKGEWEQRDVSSFSKDTQSRLKEQGYTESKAWVRKGADTVLPKDVMPVNLQNRYTQQMTRQNIDIHTPESIHLKPTANGAYDATLSAILINPSKANETTLSHEFGHFFFETMYTAYRNKLLSDKMENDFTGLLASLKINPVSQPHLGTRASELLADVFSAYSSGSALKGKVSEALKSKGLDKPVDGIIEAYKQDAYRAWKMANRPDIVLSPATVDFMRNILGKDIGEIQAQVSDKVDVPEGMTKEDYAKQVVSERAPDVVYNTRGDDVSYTQPMAMEAPTSRKSKVYTKTLEALNLTSDPDLSLEYTPIRNAEEAAKATRLMEQDPAKVKEMIITGKTDGVLNTALMMAYENYMWDKGNHTEAVKMMAMRSDEQTRRGQEIQFERMSRFGKNDITQSDFWIRALRVAKLEAAIEKMPNFKNKSQADFAQWKRNLTEALSKQVADKSITLRDALDKINRETGSNLLYQEDVLDTYVKAYDWVYDKLDNALNIRLSEKEVSKLNDLANKLKDKAGTFDGKVITDEQAQAIADLQRVIKEANPSSTLKVAMSTISRLNLLSNVGTLMTNVVSNSASIIPEMITRRLTTGKMSGYVSDDLSKSKYAYATRIFNISGLCVPTMRPEDFRREITFKGERTISSEGEGALRAAARFGEKLIFKWGLGYPDVVTKTLAFNDSANLQISKYVDTQIPNAPMSQKTAMANKMFEDVWSINPSSDIAVDIRNKAILDAEIATYTNKGKLSTMLSDIRVKINKGTGDLMLGDIIAPFVATPANVVSMGLQYSAGSLYGLYNIKTILADIRNQNLSDVSRNAITCAVRNGIGALLAVALAAMIDDEEYIPPYEACSQAERELIKAKNGVFNSFKFGDTYISLDFLGVLGTPLAGILMAKRQGGIGYLGGIGYQLTQLPLIDSAAEAKNMFDTATKDPERAAQDFLEGTVNNIIARTVPAFVSTVVNVSDPYVRDTKGLSFIDKLTGRFAPWTLPKSQSYTTGGEVLKGVDQLYKVLFGSRVKIERDSPLIQALNTLDLSGDLPYIGDFTNRGRFKDYTAEQKLDAKEKFAREFKKEAEILVRSSSYMRATSKEQAEMIKKLRSKIVKGL